MPGICSEESRLLLSWHVTCTSRKKKFFFASLSSSSYHNSSSLDILVFNKERQHLKNLSLRMNNKWKGVKRFQFLCFISSPPLFIRSNYQDSLLLLPCLLLQSFLLQRNDIKSVVVLRFEPAGRRRRTTTGAEESNLNIRKIEEAFGKK